MSVASTYRRMVEQITAGIDFCRSYLGERYSGLTGLTSDLLAEGTRLAIISHTPGHPEQAEDALNQSGSDAGLFRYRGESLASWRARVQNPWPGYEQAGTPVQLLRAINEWGHIVFPATWHDSGLVLIEGPLDKFRIFILAGMLPWGASWKWGDGSRYGQPKLMWGITNAEPEDVNALHRIVNKWKRGISKGTGCIVLSGHAWGEPALVWGGFMYGPGTSVVFRF